MSEHKRLSEKDVAEIRGRVDALDASLREISEGSEQPDSFDISDEFHEYAFSDMRKLLADRDAHLADLKEAREIIFLLRAAFQYHLKLSHIDLAKDDGYSAEKEVFARSEEWLANFLERTK